MSARVNAFGSGHNIKSPAPSRKPAVVDQQVAYLDFARDPRIAHLEVPAGNA